jgi:osmoprotectant transport system permease protein
MTSSRTSASSIFSYLSTAANWEGPSGFLHRLVQHLGYSGLTLGIALAVALPLGLLTGHTRRGGISLTLVSNASRSLPTLGLLIIFAIVIGVGLEAAIIPLLLLAIPPILVNTDLGIRSVDATVVDAAYGMGMTPIAVLARVEFPLALPLIILGLRTAALQVVATATIAAYVGLGGLGRYIIDGEASANFTELGAGAVVVACFAIVTEGLFQLAQRVIVSPGVRQHALSD